MENINEIDGVKIGNAQDYNGGTGITVILCPKGARAGVDIRGGGPASRETPLLNPVADAEVIHSVVLSGGSAFGLDAAGDVHAVKLHSTLGMAGGIFVAHVTTFFHGGKVELVCVSVSGSVRTIPAGNTK